MISSFTGIVTIITDWIGTVNSHLLNRCKKIYCLLIKLVPKKKSMPCQNPRNPDSDYITEKLQSEHSGSMLGMTKH